MSEYRFTGPFYNDNEEHAYESPSYTFTSESVAPPPAEDSKKEKKKGGFFKTVFKTICIALIAGVVGGGHHDIHAQIFADSGQLFLQLLLLGGGQQVGIVDHMVGGGQGRHSQHKHQNQRRGNTK